MDRFWNALKQLQVRWILSGIAIAWLAGCAPGNQVQSLSLGGKGAPVIAPDDGVVTIIDPVTTKMVESFTQAEPSRQLDLLIVNDTSSSMSEAQSKLATQFASLVSGLGDIDYRIGTTTANLETTGEDGRLLMWEGTLSNVLSAGTRNGAKAFENTIRRKENASSSRPVDAAIRAFEQSQTANLGFFRRTAATLLLIVSDADQTSADASAALNTSYRNAFGDAKSLYVTGIVVKPGDDDCQKAQKGKAGTGATSRGHYADGTATLASSSGLDLISLCEADYSASLNELSRKLKKVPGSFELSKSPVNAHIKVDLEPQQNIQYEVQGRRLVFETAPAIGTKIIVTYESD